MPNIPLQPPADAGGGADIELLKGSTYLDFLALWKDADRNIPILKEAKAE